MSDSSGWIFTAYEKIPENTRKWKLSEQDYRNFAKTAWVVTEKIHGANFCMVTNGNEIRCAKRKAFLDEGDDFFQYRSIAEKLQDRIKNVFFTLREFSPLRISVYGELFGGGYPHPEVRQNPEFQPIQTGIYYSPKIEFCAFDIAMDTGEGRNYLDYDRALRIFHQVNLLCAEPLFLGKYENALAYPLGFESTIPALLSLPAFPGNKAEGIIIKPQKNFCVETKKGRGRPILKKKISEFAEDKKFHEAKKWSAKVYRPTEKLKDKIEDSLTRARFDSAVSKIGRVKPNNEKKVRQLCELIAEDIREHFQDNYEHLYESLSRSEKEEFDKILEQKVEQSVRNRL